MNELHKILEDNAHAFSKNVEGHSGINPLETEALDKFVKRLPVNSKILEIGFNAGHSAATMLSSRPDVTLTSVDIATHAYIDSAKKNY